MIPLYLQSTQFKGRRIHVGCCGSIAAYKSLDLCRAFQKSGLSTSGVLTAAAEQFITRLSLQALGVSPLFSEMFSEQSTIYDHLEPGQNAALMLIHPATANTISKLSYGIADTMLTCQALAFPGPVLIVPAMNPNLWNAPVTLENVARLQHREHVFLLNPDQGQVACGDEGSGKLPPPIETYFQTLQLLSKQDLSGQKVLLSLGATREFWDPVRFWSNPSTGRMGAALALTAWLRGAEVTCVCAPSDVWLPPSIRRIDVVSAQDMLNICSDLWADFDIGAFCAAVCDFRPKERQEHKFKKKSAKKSLSIEFAENQDILKTLGQRKTQDQRLLGFAAESDPELLPAAREKLIAKNLDLIAANLINHPETGFQHHTNSVLLISAQGEQTQLPLSNKADIAWTIWDWILRN